MADLVTTARTAREALAKGLSALQSNPNSLPEFLTAAEPIATAMGALHRIERSGGAEVRTAAPEALDAVRKALSILQTRSTTNPQLIQVMEVVAGSLGQIFSLTQMAPPQQAPAGAGPQPVAHQPAPWQPVQPQQARPQASPGPYAPPPQPAIGFPPPVAPAQAPGQPQQGFNPSPQPPPAFSPAMPQQQGFGPAQKQAPAQPGAWRPGYGNTQPVPQAQPPQVAPAVQQFSLQQAAVGPAMNPTPQAVPRAAGPYGPAPQPAGAPNYGGPAQPPPMQQPPAQASAPKGAGDAGRMPQAYRQQEGMPVVEAELGTHSASNFYKGLSANDIVDSGGLFIATYNIPKMGQTLRVHVSLPGGYEFDAIGVVRWTREARESMSSDIAPPGFGMQFTTISPEARNLVYRYARNREPLFHDDL